MTNSVLDNNALGTFFAWAPLVLGVIIYFAYWLAKHNEGSGSVNAHHTYACANCGKRGVREHMVPLAHEGAVGYYCSNCARG